MPTSAPRCASTLARARGPHCRARRGRPPPDSLGTSVSRSPRSSRWRGAARRRAGLRVHLRRARHTRRVRFRRGRGVLRRARGLEHAGCFCSGVESAVSQSDTYAAQAAALAAAACGVAKADLATHATCAALSAGEGAAGAAESTQTPRLLPEPATWAYVVLDASDPTSPRFRLAGRRRPPAASTACRRCLRGDALRARLPPLRGGVRAEHDHADRGRSSRCLD